MTPAQYRAAIRTLGLSQEAAGVALGYSPRSGQRFAASGPPAAVAALVRLLVAGKISLDDVAGAIRPSDRR